MGGNVRHYYKGSDRANNTHNSSNNEQNMSKQYIDFECFECECQAQVEYGEEVTTEDGNLICGECDPTRWENLDFPIWISYESYNDTWALLDNFTYKTGLDQEDVLDPREFKYTVFSVWFKVTENCRVEGPYDEKEGEKI